jgi:quinolinate synthase
MNMKKLAQDKLIARINKLRKDRNAVILAHNYELGEVQDIADFAGDSLELSIKARDLEAAVLVFCGVTFMAETAYLLSPDKTVLLPVREAGCLMADMAGAEELKKLKRQHPGAFVVTYVNSSAAVKAESDICVTSANALKIVGGLPRNKEIIFVPDQNLGAYIQRETGREMILWPGFCPTHMRITREMVLARKKEFPDAEVIVHPESRLDVIDLADRVLSTGGMCRYVRETKDSQIIVGTEAGIIYRLRKENPAITYIAVSEQAVCPTMKLIRLEDVLNSLEKMEHKITVPEKIRAAARKPIELMLEKSG